MFELTSPAFVHQGELPSSFTCEGADRSPELHWTDGPPGTKSFVLIVDDPDAPDPKAPKTIWVHWVLYDLPAATRGLGEGVRADDLPHGAREGTNDWKRTGWGGPCPPIGRHRYFFKLYALDTELGALKRGTKHDVEAAMKGHVLASTELMGTYQKTKGR